MTDDSEANADRQMRTGILARCSNGHFFVTDIGMGPSVEGLTIRNSTDQCPRPDCRAPAEVLDGTYSMVEGVVTLLTAPEMTWERLRELKSLLEDTLADGTPEQAAEAVARVLPGIEPFIPRDSTALGTWVLAFVELLRFLLGIAQEQPEAPDVNINIEVVVEEADSAPPQQQPPPAQPPPAQPPPAQPPPAQP